MSRAAIRGQIAHIAFPLFCDSGFDSVTFDELALAVGVSRSTLLRYFPTKEDVVLFVFEPLGDAIAGAVAARPATESTWTALRCGLEPAVRRMTTNPDESLAVLRLIGRTPALCGALRDQQASWRPLLVRSLSQRRVSATEAPLVILTKAAAALDCLAVALETWTANDAVDDLDSLVAQAFAALAGPD